MLIITACELVSLKKSNRTKRLKQLLIFKQKHLSAYQPKNPNYMSKYHIQKRIKIIQKINTRQLCIETCQDTIDFLNTQANYPQYDDQQPALQKVRIKWLSFVNPGKTKFEIITQEKYKIQQHQTQIDALEYEKFKIESIYSKKQKNI